MHITFSHTISGIRKHKLYFSNTDDIVGKGKKQPTVRYMISLIREGDPRFPNPAL
jgi:hypothetical protein